MSTLVPLIIPLNACRNHAYIYNEHSHLYTPDDYDDGARFGGNYDVEFKEHPTSDTILDGLVRPRQGVTVQVSSIFDHPAMIFDHPDHVQYAAATGRRDQLRNLPFQSGAVFIDYLQAHGEDIQVYRCDHEPTLAKLPPFLADMFAFFATAEGCMVFTDEYKEEMRLLAVEGTITSQRRLSTRDIVGCDNWQLDYNRVNGVVVWNKREYALRIRWIDACALHGVASYRDLLINTGQETDVKDLMKELGLIEDMHEAYFSHPAEFDAYALNDLKIYSSLFRNNQFFETFYESLGLHPYYKTPHLTIGRTMASVLEAAIFHAFGLPHDSPSAVKKELLAKACYQGTAEHFRRRPTESSARLAKVIGGRVGPEHPTLATFHEPYVDHDWKSCYGSGLRVQPYPFGRPMVIEYPVDSTINKYKTLRQWLVETEDERVPRLWMAYVSLLPEYTLTYPQTFFPSYFGFNQKKLLTIPPPDEPIIDEQEKEYEFAVDTGHVKLCTHHIENAPLGQMGLEWIRYACHAQQSNELLDNLYVMCAAYYKKSEYVPTVHALLEAWQEHEGENTCEDMTYLDSKGRKKSKQRKDLEECFAWTSIGLDELLIDKLLANRDLYPKKHALNNLFKLGTNTTYGILVSPYFAIGNTIVGSNVTESGRLGCWCMANYLNGAQSITDGTQFPLNKVVYPDNGYLTMAKLWPLRFGHNNRHDHYTLKPLAGYDRIHFESHPTRKILHRWKNGINTPLEDTIVDATTDPVVWSKNIDTWINEATLAHMQQVSNPRLNLLHQETKAFKVLNKASEQGPPVLQSVIRKGVFECEAKDLFTKGCFHGAANHYLVNAHDPIMKSRSYHRSRRYDAYKLVKGVLVQDSRYAVDNPPTVLYKAILADPHAVPRGSVYVHLKIIKPDELRLRWTTLFRHTPLSFGDSYCVPGLMREYSPSHSRYCSPTQWQAIQKEYEFYRKKDGQYIERFFLNADTTIDYARMLVEVQQALEDPRCLSLMDAFDPHRHHNRKGGSRTHPELPTLLAIKARLQHVYQGILPDDAFDEADSLDQPIYYTAATA